MFLRIVFFLLLITVFSNAEVLTYTAYSKESQAHADQEAIAGVARQISAKIDATTQVKRSEIQKEERSYLEKLIETKNSIHTDLELQGIRIIQGKMKDGVFSATASIDLDKLTAPLQRKMSEIQKEISAKEEKALNLLNKYAYTEVTQLLNEIESLSKKLPEEKKTAEVKAMIETYKAVISLENKVSKKYPSLYRDFLFYNPSGKAVELNSKLEFISDSLEKSLKKIEIILPKTSSLNVTNDFLSFEVKVKNQDRPIENFSIYVTHQEKVIAEEKSDKNGVVVFKIPSSSLRNSPFILRIFAALSIQYENIKGLASQELPYQLNLKSCNLKLNCLEEPYICTEISNSLSNKLGISVQVSSTAPLSAKINVESKRSMQQLSSYQVSLDFYDTEFSCSLSRTGVGKNEKEAVRKAIQKMNFNSCQALNNFCKP